MEKATKETEKIIEEMGKLLWRRRIFYLLLTLFLSLMVAFMNIEIEGANIFLAIPIVLLCVIPALSYIFTLSEFKNVTPVLQISVDFTMFLSVGWTVGAITFYHLIATNSLSLSYLIAFICGIIGGGIPYFFHWEYSPDDIIGDALNDQEIRERDKIAEIVIHANMWEYLAVGIIPLVIFMMRCQ